MQEAMMARMEREMLDAAAAMSPDAVMKMWFQSMPQKALALAAVLTSPALPAA
jgi:hypothetical protein